MTPLVIQQSRFKLALFLLPLIAVTAVLAFMTFVTAHMPHLWGLLALTLFAPLGLATGITGAATACSIWQPSTISADENGVVYRTWRSERRFVWNDIEEFIVFSPEQRLRSPGCRLKEGVAPRRYASFGRWWEKSAEEIVDRLRDMQSKQNPPPVSASPLPSDEGGAG